MEISPVVARAYLVGQLGLRQQMVERGQAGIRSLLAALRCIQLDPIDRIGTNADLVALARVDGLRKGDVYRALLPGHAFEHFAKERCLLPASAFPYYRDQATQTPWWRHTERMRRLPEGVLEAVLAELTERGPATVDELSDHGRVEQLDWSGWKGTPKATKMALDVLWTRCQVVVCGRTPRGKRYDVPLRALPDVASAVAPGDFARWAVLERVEAAGLLSTAGGPHWSMLGAVRTSGLPEQLVEEGELELVSVAGSRRTYLASRGFMDRSFPQDDGRMRILAPLDPVLWDRKLVKHAFGFEYIWEIYKPVAKRRWGYYVCPLLHRGELVGRVEAHVEEGRLVLDQLWEEPGVTVDRDALNTALRRHEAAVA
jgi:uncharacterized protein YcaQ